jgi:hypothetical protein
MEASGAGLATAPATGDGQQQAGEQQQTDGQQQPDLAAVLDTIGQQFEQQRTMLQSLAESRQEQAPQEQQQTDANEGQGEIDLSFLDESAPTYQGPEAAMQQLGSLIDNIAAQRAQALVEPLQKDIGELRTDRAIDDLVAKYPQIADPEVGKTVIDTAQRWAQKAGHPELGSMPEFFELVYLAGRAADQSKQEGSTQESAAALEGAGGASPGGAGQGTAPTTESVTANWGAKRLPLFTGSR